MANLVVTPGLTTLFLQFIGLQYPDSAYEMFAFRVGNLTYNSTVNGITFDRYDTSLYITCGSTYTCSGAAKYNGSWFTIDAGTNYSTLPCVSRPTNWAWSFSLTSGEDCLIPATEWLSFQQRINAFRSYKNLSAYGFTGASYVYADADVEYWLANQLRNAIYDMNTSVPAVVESGDDFDASWLIQLTNALNSIT